MKIAYLVNTYPDISLTFIRREIHALERAGHSIVRVALRPADRELVDVLDREELQKTHHLLAQPKRALIGAALGEFLGNPARFLRTLVEALKMGQRNSRGRFRHLVYLIEAAYLKRFLKRRGASHLHVHFGTNSTTVARLQYHLGGEKFSFTVHGPEELDQQFGLSLREKLEDASAVVGISHYTIAQLRRLLPPVSWKKLHLVHCVVDRKYFAEPKPIPGESKLMVCTGRLAPQKGQVTLIEGLKELVDRGEDVEMALLGGGEMEEEIRGLVEKFGLESRVKMLGWVDGETIQSYLERARVLVLPSYAEGLPVAIMESLAMARPVITTYVAGIPELVVHGENGWLVPPCDSERLADAMQQALNADLAMLNRMGQSGRAAVLQEHDADREAAKLDEIFRRVGATASRRGFEVPSYTKPETRIVENQS